METKRKQSQLEFKWKQNENSHNYKNQENMKQPQLGMPDKKIKALLCCD